MLAGLPAGAANQNSYSHNVAATLWTQQCIYIFKDQSHELERQLGGLSGIGGEEERMEIMEIQYSCKKFSKNIFKR